MKERYSIYEAKTRLSEIIRLVKRNRAVVITDRGHEVARVVAMEPVGRLDRRLKALVQAGILTSTPSANPAEIVPIARKPGALRRFLEDRHRF